MLDSILFILLLVTLLGVLNGAQVATLCARRNRLELEKSNGFFGATTALELVARPGEVVAGIRVGIALVIVAILLVGAGSILEPFSTLFIELFGVSLLSTILSTTFVVLAVSLAMLLLGELIPTEMASRYPEELLRWVSPIIAVLLVPSVPCARFAARLVSLLTGPSQVELVSDADVEEDIRELVDEGQRAGVIEPGEREIINRVFKLDDKPVVSLMCPRSDVVFLSQSADIKSSIAQAAHSKHSWFPVRGEGEDDILGIISIHDLVDLANDSSLHPGGISDLLSRPIEVPESMSALKLLELFRESPSRFAIVRDEHGGIAGIVTVYDVLQVIVGDIGEVSDEQKMIVKRDDHSFLVDASADVADLFDILEIEGGLSDQPSEFHSLGGFIMTTLGHVPREGERFEAFGFTFEVLDMDNKRIDKVLVRREPQRKVVAY